MPNEENARTPSNSSLGPSDSESSLGTSDNEEVKKYIRAILGDATPSHPIYRFYERMEHAIRTSGHTKMDIARLTGIDRRRLSDKCVRMSLVELMRFCYYTDTSADWLLGLASVHPPHQYYKDRFIDLSGIDMTDKELTATILMTKKYRKKHDKRFNKKENKKHGTRKSNRRL